MISPERRDRLIAIGSIAVIAIGLLLVFRILTAPEFIPADPSLIDYTANPIQETVQNVYIPVFRFGDANHYLDAKASYEISGQLVSKRRYVSGFMHKLSPWDYALAWGGLVQQLDKLKFKQVVRFALYKYSAKNPVDPHFVGRHFSNNHLIPANTNIRKAMARAGKGDKIKLQGYLVYVKSFAKKGGSATWNSSLTREDEGNGACEIIYVESLQINDRLYR